MSIIFFPLKAAIVLFLLLLNALFWLVPLVLLILPKLAVPAPAWRDGCTRLMRRLGEGWVVTMDRIVRLFAADPWDVELPADLRGREGWYLLLCNHQSWIDILVLIRLFAGRLPFPVFFTKKELLRLPLFGQAMWGLDFPFIERYTRRDIQHRPELRGRDLKTVRAACEKAKRMPTTLIVFPEGTRFTPGKHRRQGSPCRHLLSPRAGGTAVALATLGDRLDGVIDLTLAYPQGRPGLLAALVGRTGPVIVRGRWVEIPPALKEGDYAREAALRQRFRDWLHEIWRQKDELLHRLLS